MNAGRWEYMANWNFPYNSSYCSLSTQLIINKIIECLPTVLGPVVQSVFSLTSSLRAISLTILADSLLMEVRGKSISYSSFIKKENETEEKEIERKIVEHNLTPGNPIALDELKDQLQTLRKPKMHGHLIRSRAKIIEEDEKPTKYFCNLETQYYANKIIPKIEKI